MLKFYCKWCDRPWGPETAKAQEQEMKRCGKCTVRRAAPAPRGKKRGKR
jgi:hypothetical protein